LFTKKGKKKKKKKNQKTKKKKKKKKKKTPKKEPKEPKKENPQKKKRRLLEGIRKRGAISLHHKSPLDLETGTLFFYMKKGKGRKK